MGKYSQIGEAEGASFSVGHTDFGPDAFLTPTADRETEMGSRLVCAPCTTVVSIVQYMV
jgi:hypothetical protein